MNITVSSGKYDVIQSGLVIADSWNSDIEFHLQLSKITVLNVTLRFVEQEGADKNFEVLAESNALVFKCTNFMDSTGTSYPIELATIKGKKVFLNFRNYGEKNVMRKIEYAFYSEK